MLIISIIVATYSIAFVKGVTIATPWLALILAGCLYAGTHFCRDYFRHVMITLAQFTVFATYFALLTDSVAYHAVLRDSLLTSADTALGMDARAIKEWVLSIRPLQRLSMVAYFSFVPQIALALLLYDRVVFLKRMVISSIVTIVIFSMTPSIGNFADGPVADHNVPIKARILALSSGEIDVLHAEEVEGIICAPSFHTIVACLLMATFWGQFFRMKCAAVLLNVLMILSTVPIGGHYVIDVILGILVSLIVIRSVK